MRRLRLAGIGCGVMLGLVLTAPAAAQAKDGGFLRCRLMTSLGNDNYNIYWTPVVTYRGQPVSEIRTQLVAWLAAKGITVDDWQYTVCEVRPTAEALREKVDDNIGSDGSPYQLINGFGGTSVHRIMQLPPEWSEPGWTSKSVSGQRLTIPFASPGYKEGYESASIDLRYKFLICDDEVQVAYSLDRASLKHSMNYQLAGKNGVRVLQPDTEPAAPTTITLSAQVRRGGYALNLFVRDTIAGEALGMGCFTGQTKTIGTIGQIFTGKPTRQELPGLLGLLSLSNAQPIPFALQQASVHDRAEGEANAEREAAARAQAEAEKRDLADRNARAAADAKAQTDAIKARQEAYQRQMRDYQAGVAAAAAAKAKYDADKAANDAAQADYAARRAAYEATLKGK